MPTTKLRIEPTPEGAPRNSRSGSRASSPMRCSAVMNAAMPMTPTTYEAPSAPLVQPHSRPCSATIEQRHEGDDEPQRAPVVDAVVPPGVRDVQRAGDESSETMPIGTFTRKTQRQPAKPRIVSCPARNPPTTGPSTLEVPKTRGSTPGSGRAPEAGRGRR
jgi:hypothetical protein